MSFLGGVREQTFDKITYRPVLVHYGVCTLGQCSNSLNALKCTKLVNNYFLCIISILHPILQVPLVQKDRKMLVITSPGDTTTFFSKLANSYQTTSTELILQNC